MDILELFKQFIHPRLSNQGIAGKENKSFRINGKIGRRNVESNNEFIAEAAEARQDVSDIFAIVSRVGRKRQMAVVVIQGNTRLC